MARAKQPARYTTVSFEGPPDAVEAYLPVDSQRRRDVRVSIATDDGWTPVRALTAPAGDQTLVRLVLPSTTPCTELDALIEIGDERYEAVVRTAACTELASSPSALDLMVEDSIATASVHVVNVGNVPVDLPDISVFGLMMEGGVETAIGAGLMSGEAGLERFGRFADALAERHGGLARVVIESGAGRLEPGRSTTVSARIRLGERLAGGRRYHGVWELATLNIPVSLLVPEGPTVPKRPRRTTKKGAST